MAQQRGVQLRSLPLQSDHRYEHVEAPAGIKGGFRFSLTDGTWWWSPGMYALHGYPSTQLQKVRPSTRLILTHRHPADRRAMAAAWAHLIADGSLAAFHYRILGADGVIRPVFALASTDFNRGHEATLVTGVLQLEEFSTRTGSPSSQPTMSSTAWP
jgi:PAS domain-containing protein